MRGEGGRGTRTVLAVSLRLPFLEESEASGSSNLSAVTSKKSELFDHIVYLSEVCDVMAIAMAELPNLLSPPDVAEALLRLKFGPQIICHMVANQPDSFNEGE